MSSLPTLNYTTPEEFVNYYYEKLKTDLSVYNLQISKVGFVGFFLNLLGYTHFDIKQYYDSLFKEAFVGTAQIEESQYLHASTYGYIPTFASSSIATGTIEFDMINWLPRRQAGVVRREVIIGYSSESSEISSSSFKSDDFDFFIDAIYKFIEVEINGSYYYYADILTSDGVKYNIPSASSVITVPLYSTRQYIKQEVEVQLPSYNFGSFQTHYFSIPAGHYLTDLKVYITKNNSSTEEEYDIKYTKYLEKGTDKSVFLRKYSSTNYILEFGSGIRGEWVSAATVRLVIKYSRGNAGNLIDKTDSKLQISGNTYAFDYKMIDGSLTTTTAESLSIIQVPLVNFDYSEGGEDPLSGEDLRDDIVNYIQTRENLVTRQDFYNIASTYFDDFKFMFKKINIFDNTFYLCRSFRNRNQEIFYLMNHTESVMNFHYMLYNENFSISAEAILSGIGTLNTGLYEYFIVCVDFWGRSEPSTRVQVSVTTQNAVRITWTHVPNTETYRVYGRHISGQNQYWEISVGSTPSATYSYTDIGSSGQSSYMPTGYELTELIYRPTFTISDRVFVCPFLFKHNTRMNYYDGYLIKELLRVNFSDISHEYELITSGLDVPMTYLNLEYDSSLLTTFIKLKSYEDITNFVFSISITSDNISILDERMECFPLSNNEFIYEYTDTYGTIIEEMQIEVKGGISDSIISSLEQDFTITSENNTLLIKCNDDSEDYSDSFVTVSLTIGVRTAAQVVTDINTEFGEDIASTYTTTSGGIRIKLTPPTGGSVTNIFIGESSTCLDVLGLTGSDTTPAVLNGEITTHLFTYVTSSFYQLHDISDQVRLMRYNSSDTAHIINIPLIDNTEFESDENYYIDKFINFISNSNFKENRMIADNVQCRFLNSFICYSKFIQATFLQGGQIFSSEDYTWLDPVIDIINTPYTPNINIRYLIGSSPIGEFIGHTDDIASFDINTATWSFYSPEVDDFVLVNENNLYYRWDGSSWVSIPDIIFPLKMRIEIKIDKLYVQKNNINVTTERNNLEFLLAEYLQKNFTGANVVFYNSMIVEFIHTNRPFIKSVKVFVTDSSTIPNELDNGVEILSDDTILTGLKNKVDIVEYSPIIVYWDVNNLDLQVYIE
jgi:hypothetical protein